MFLKIYAWIFNNIDPNIEEYTYEELETALSNIELDLNENKEKFYPVRNEQEEPDDFLESLENTIRTYSV